MTALELSGVDVDLGGRPVLRGIDLRVAAGELVGLLGPNGAGKTTLLRAALGLVPLRRGAVLVDDSPLRRGRSTIGYVPQRHEFAWDFPISVERAALSGRTGLTRFGRRPGPADWRAVGEALDRVDLLELRTRPVGALSGGQRQRVLVARALAAGPDLLLLDEPFTGLDLPTQELLAALFERLAAEGTAVVMTTHDLLAALGTTSRVVLLNGRVRADGRPRDVRDPEVWMQTFGVGPESPLLRLVSVV